MDGILGKPVTQGFLNWAPTGIELAKCPTIENRVIFTFGYVHSYRIINAIGWALM